MIRGEIIDEYRRMNSEDRAAFHGWLKINTVVGVISLLTLIVVTSIFSGENSGSLTAETGTVTIHAEAR
jgi:hypothetical protein